jgi:hypothetical protein
VLSAPATPASIIYQDLEVPLFVFEGERVREQQRLMRMRIFMRMKLLDNNN